MSFRACCRLLALLLVFTVSLQTAKAQFQTRTFKVTPDFLAWEATTKTAAAKTTSSTSPNADPFGPDPAPATSLPDDTPPTHPVSARQTLEAVGLTFPEGASASFNPLTGILTVTNSPENLVLAAAYTQALHEQEPATVAYTLTVIEGPGELIRQANATAPSPPNTTPPHPTNTANTSSTPTAAASNSPSPITSPPELPPASPSPPAPPACSPSTNPPANPSSTKKTSSKPSSSPATSSAPESSPVAPQLDSPQTHRRSSAPPDLSTLFGL